MKELLTQLDHKTISEAEGFHRISPDYKIIEDISSELSTTVFGQDKAMHELAGAITRSMAGFSDPRRPEMTAMFLGPTGVGKTEAGKALAKFLYKDKWGDKFLRIDCTQLQEPHSVGRLKGSEPSYVGYGDNNILISPDFLRRGGVIVFDEIEKAHPNIWRWLLPVLEEGQQKALVPVQGAGRGYSSELATLNFAKTYLIMTANVGAEALHRARAGEAGIGFHMGKDKPDMEKIGIAELKKAFKDMPEFLGRLDATVVFHDLERPQFERIFNKFIDEVNLEQRYGHNFLAVTKELRDFILDHAQTGEYGAREIRHRINEHLVNPASDIKVSGILPDGHPLIGDIEEGRVIFWTSKIEEKKDLVPVVEPPVPVVTKVGEKKDAGSNIGNKPPIHSEETPPEEEVEDEKEIGTPEIDSEYREGGRENVSFYVPFKPGVTIDLAITVHRPGKRPLNQAIEGLPLV